MEKMDVNPYIICICMCLEEDNWLGHLDERDRNRKWNNNWNVKRKTDWTSFIRFVSYSFLPIFMITSTRTTSPIGFEFRFVDLFSFCDAFFFFILHSPSHLEFGFCCSMKSWFPFVPSFYWSVLSNQEEEAGINWSWFVLQLEQVLLSLNCLNFSITWRNLMQINRIEYREHKGRNMNTNSNQRMRAYRQQSWSKSSLRTNFHSTIGRIKLK